MRFASSVDGGKTFQPTLNPAPNDPKGEQSYPYMTVSDDNKIYISYLNLDYSKIEDNAGTPTVLRIVTSSDGGKTFAPSAVADKGACQCCATVAVLGPEGEIIRQADLSLRTSPKLLKIILRLSIRIMKSKLLLYVILLWNAHSTVEQQNYFQNQAKWAGIIGS
jgi:hypothetical protein